jgi:hypothetical protein
MFHSVGDLQKNFIIQNFYEGSALMTSHNDNSTTISGGNVTGNQFAAGSTEFKGAINNITSNEEKKLENLTEKLIQSLKDEPNIEGADPSEIIDAVDQVRQEAKKKSINKLSLKGIVAGISMVMQNVQNISENTKAVYEQWHSHIESLFGLGG